MTPTTVLSQFEGALLLARTYQSLEPMHRAETALKLLLRDKSNGMSDHENAKRK